MADSTNRALALLALQKAEAGGNVDLSEYATKSEVETQLGSYAKTTALNGYVTSSKFNTEVAKCVKTDQLAEQLGDYAKQEEVNTELEKYSTKTELTTQLESYATKTEIGNIANRLAYTKVNSTKDFNTLTKTGEHDISNLTYINSPYDNEEGEKYPCRVSVVAIGSYIKQKVFRLKPNDNVTYLRTYDGTVWTDWLADQPLAVTQEEYDRLKANGELKDNIYYIKHNVEEKNEGTTEEESNPSVEEEDEITPPTEQEEPKVEEIVPPTVEETAPPKEEVDNPPKEEVDNPPKEEVEQ